MSSPSNDLQQIRAFPDLVRYLEDELHWPLNEYSFDDLTFEYSPDEVGLKDEDAAKIRDIRQLKPIRHDQPWGIFFVEFEKKKLPVVVLRRILNHLVLKKRASAKGADAPQWASGDILFISAFGDLATGAREIAFAHFQQEAGDLPTLRVLGWDGGDTPLHVAHVASQLKTRLRWPNDPGNAKAWREEWSKPFVHRIGHIIRTSNELAEVMAHFARRIRDAARTLMAHETDRGALQTLYHAFQTSLIHDLTAESFADTYAQTITYGLLTAAISRTDMSGGRDGTALLAENIADIVPVTNPFLKEMLETFLKAGGRRGGIDFDELGIQDVVALLRGHETDLPSILRDFGKRTRGEDPVIHFYEQFLSAYNKQLKIQRGVFYTPQPVVSYIVRSVHELLRTEFNLEDGLADTITWGEMIRRQPHIKLPNLSNDPARYQPLSENEPFVQILDPATGTGTFLVEAIDVIYRTLKTKWKNQKLTDAQQQVSWNAYVPEHLLPRLHAYELMMAPYAIAHMKIGLKLAETGYKFKTEERARVYLTNALEPWVKQLPLIGFDALAHEAAAVNEIKREKRFTVVLGNPPYSKKSQNLGDQFLSLIERFRMFSGERIKEPGAILFERDINNDYVKFIGLNQNVLKKPQIGALGIITSNSYLDGKNFRGVRDALTETFDEIRVVNLHGDSRSGDLARRGITDENVFVIETGVSILLAARSSMHETIKEISYSEIIGTYDEKAELLITHDFSLEGKNFPIDIRRYKSFLPSESVRLEEYSEFQQLDGVYQLSVDGIKTSRDGLVIANTPDECAAKIRAFMGFSGSATELEEMFGIKVTNWDYKSAQLYLRSSFSEQRIFKVAYRPLDFRYIYYDSNLVFSHREGKMSHLIRGENFAIVCASRLSAKGFNHILPADCLVEMKYASHDTNSRVFPAFVINDLLTGSAPQANIGRTARTIVGNQVNVSDWIELNNAIFAVLNSPKYRTRFFDEIKNDFPRVPALSDNTFRKQLASFGRELIDIQLLKVPLPNAVYPFYGPLAQQIKTPELDGERLRISATAYFGGVSKEVFEFNLAGYQVCKNWVSSGNKSGIQRKGQPLTQGLVQLYRRVLFAIQQTMETRVKIDSVLSEYLGW